MRKSYGVLAIVLLAGSQAAAGLFTEGLRSTALVDTPKFSIPFVSGVHGLYSYGLDFGIHPNATKGLDPSLGEEEYPPFPPGGGLTMFTTINGNSILDL